MTQATHGVQLLELAKSKVTQTYDNEAPVQLAEGDLKVVLVTINLSDPFQDPSSKAQEGGVADSQSDIWLVLQVGNDFELPVKASQTVVPERSTQSYRFESDDVPGASLRVALDASTDSDAVEQFEDILSQYCAYHDDDRSDAGQVELMDEKGHIMGKLVVEKGMRLEEDPSLRNHEHSKSPVLLELPSSGQAQRDGPLHVRPLPIANEEVSSTSSSSDWLVRGATLISRGIVMSASYAGSGMQKAADSYTARSAAATASSSATPAETTKDQALDAYPVHFEASSKAAKGASSLRTASTRAVSVSHTTTKAILDVASGVGSKIGRTTGIQSKRSADGIAVPPKGVRGVINRSLVAASVVLDGIDTGAQRLLEDGGDAAGKVIAHRFGNEARVLAGHAGHTTRNVFLVYKDISGVRRKCLLKVAGGTFRAKLDDGSEVVMQVDEEGLPQPVKPAPLEGSSGLLPPPTRSFPSKKA